MTSDGFFFWGKMNSYTTCYYVIPSVSFESQAINISLPINSFNEKQEEEVEGEKKHTSEGWYKKNECLYQLS